MIVFLVYFFLGEFWLRSGLKNYNWIILNFFIENYEFNKIGLDNNVICILCY